jgi:hypothetical protein
MPYGVNENSAVCLCMYLIKVFVLDCSFVSEAVSYAVNHDIPLLRGVHKLLQLQAIGVGPQSDISWLEICES